MISCLMISKNNIYIFKKAVLSFLRQNFKNKELIVVFEKNQQYAKEKINYLKKIKNCKVILVEDGLGLGNLRNIALENAKGDFVIQWDDDEINHPDRIRLQFKNLIYYNAYACYLEDRLHYFYNTNELFIEDGSYGSINDSIKQHCPGSVLMKNKKEFKYKNYLFEGDDIDLMKQIFSKHKIATLPKHYWLYCYTYHGNNTVNFNKHIKIAQEKSYDKNFILKNKQFLIKKLLEIKINLNYNIVDKEKNILFQSGLKFK